MITNTIYTDGFGENLKFIIYTILYAEFINVYLPVIVE